MYIYIQLFLCALFVLSFNMYLGNKGEMSSVKDCRQIDVVLNCKAYKYLFKNGLIIILLVLFLSAFRSVTVGVDLNNYKLYYDNFKDGGLSSFRVQYFNYNIGFRCFTFLLAVMQLPFQIYSFIIAIFFWMTLWFFLKKHSNNPTLAIIIAMSVGLFEQSMSALRQIIALGFLIIAIALTVAWYYV